MLERELNDVWIGRWICTYMEGGSSAYYPVGLWGKCIVIKLLDASLL